MVDTPNIERLTVYINSKANPLEFAERLLLFPRKPSVQDVTHGHEEPEVIIG